MASLTFLRVKIRAQFGDDSRAGALSTKARSIDPHQHHRHRRPPRPLPHPHNLFESRSPFWGERKTAGLLEIRNSTLTVWRYTNGLKRLRRSEGEALATCAGSGWAASYVVETETTQIDCSLGVRVKSNLY